MLDLGFLTQSTLNLIHVDHNNNIISKMDHELMDAQDYSWEPLTWLVFPPAVFYERSERISCEAV